MKMYKVAAFHLLDGSEYISSQPFWEGFDRKYPSDWEGLRRALNVSTEDDYRTLAKTLERDQDLVRRYIPYFCRQRGTSDSFYYDLRVARSGSNYWIIKEICEHVRRRSSDGNKLQKWIEKEVQRYKQVGSSVWAKAVEETLAFSTE